jgi:hypothetical protein
MSLYAAGMTPAGGLHFPRDVAIFPIGSDGTGSREQMALDLTESQRFTSGAIRARAPANLEQIGFRAARERLTFTREAGGMTVVNGLGAAVTELLYNDGGMMYHLSGVVPPGGKATMKSDARAVGSIVPANLPQSSRFQYLFEHPPTGAYLAVLERSPFWSHGLTAVLEQASFHLVLGWPGGQP